MNLKMVLLIFNGLCNSGSWSQCVLEKGWRLPMNRVAANVSSLIFGGDQSRLTSAATRRGSWSRCMRKSERKLSINRRVGRAVLCAPTAATTLSCEAKDGAHE